MRSRTGAVLEGPDELGGDELAPQRHRLAPRPGARGRGPAEVAGAAGTEAAEVTRAALEGSPEVEPGRGKTPRDPLPHESSVDREHERRFELAGVPFGRGPRASQEGADPRVVHGSRRLRAGLEPGDQHLHAPAPGQLAPGGVDRPELGWINLIVRQHDPPEAVTRQAGDHLDDETPERRDRQRHGPRPADDERAKAGGNRRGGTGRQPALARGGATSPARSSAPRPSTRTGRGGPPSSARPRGTGTTHPRCPG